MLEDVCASWDVNIIMMIDVLRTILLKKFLSSQAELEPTAFLSLVRRSNH